jgi:hypothetical protein
MLSALRTSRTLLPRNSISGTHFCWRLIKLQGLVRPEGLGKFKNSPHRESNPRPSGLYHSALTTTLPRAPMFAMQLDSKIQLKLEHLLKKKKLYVQYCGIM